MYISGSSNREPDEIHCKRGIYRLRLHPEERSAFHQTLKACLESISQSESLPHTNQEQASSNEPRYSRNLQKGAGEIRSLDIP